MDRANILLQWALADLPDVHDLCVWSGYPGGVGGCEWRAGAEGDCDERGVKMRMMLRYPRAV